MSDPYHSNRNTLSSLGTKFTPTVPSNNELEPLPNAIADEHDLKVLHYLLSCAKIEAEEIIQKVS